MQDVYTKCAILENEKFMLRLVSKDDCADLLKVYSDKKSVPFFNSDNCNGDDFYYTTEKRMREAIDFWLFSYNKKYFVRWSIIDKDKKIVIGTIELFHRDAEDYFTECGLLRLDLRSDYENVYDIENIISIISNTTYELFNCKMIATKAITEASERIKALEKQGFYLTKEKLIGHDKQKYDSYYIRKKDSKFIK